MHKTGYRIGGISLMQARGGEGQHWAAAVALSRRREIWEIIRNKLRAA